MKIAGGRDFYTLLSRTVPAPPVVLTRPNNAGPYAAGQVFGESIAGDFVYAAKRVL